MRETGLAAVIDGQVETLLLGSFPSTASLARAQYYGHPRNHFWPLLGAILGEPMLELDYPVRLERLLAHHIGVWDVIGECARAGSLDSAIRDAVANSFDAALAQMPNLRRVFFNGATAGRRSRWFAERGYAVCVLPSSSPAYTIGFEAKLLAWRALLADIPDRGAHARPTSCTQRPRVRLRVAHR
ncbi:MAG: DNA-deoxyinosine glycosylase [Proteobacteria bacterium]|nr:DNA-deoxyinosine glycosylase [Burkholderiales bacterium]